MRAFSAILVWLGVPLANRTVSTIRSLQRGTFTLTAGNASATTSLSPAVDTTKTALRFLGQSTDVSVDNDFRSNGRITLTDSTTITGTRHSTNGSLTLSWEAEERY